MELEVSDSLYFNPAIYLSQKFNSRPISFGLHWEALYKNSWLGKKEISMGHAL